MDLSDQLQQWDEAAWCLAALALALAEGGDPQRRDAAVRVLEAAGASPVQLPVGSTEHQVAAQAAAPLATIAALVTGQSSDWMGLPDDALLAQGEASGQMASAFHRFLLPAMPGLAERLATPGARMLDVGTGVGAIATGFADVFPLLQVTGLDVADRVLALAVQRAAALPVSDRVVFRQGSVADLEEDAAYDLAWLPAPFVPEEPLQQGVVRICRALRPGGWLMLGHGKFSGSSLAQALNRLKTLAYGGTALDDSEAADLLRAAGLTAIVTVPTPPGAPAITIGRRST